MSTKNNNFTQFLRGGGREAYDSRSYEEFLSCFVLGKGSFWKLGLLFVRVTITRALNFLETPIYGKYHM